MQGGMKPDGDRVRHPDPLAGGDDLVGVEARVRSEHDRPAVAPLPDPGEAFGQEVAGVLG